MKFDQDKRICLIQTELYLCKFDDIMCGLGDTTATVESMLYTFQNH